MGASVLKKNRNNIVISTILMDKGFNCCSNEYNKNRKFIENNDGKILTNIDALNLKKCLRNNNIIKRFHEIYFGMPRKNSYACFPKIQKEFIKNVLNNIKKILKRNGKIHFIWNIDCNNKNTKTKGSQYYFWEINHVIKGFKLLDEYYLNKNDMNRMFPGYQTRKENGSLWDPDGYHYTVLIRNKKNVKKKCSLIDKHFNELSEW